MKYTLTLLALICGAVAAFGQSKQDSIVWRKLLDSARTTKPDTNMRIWTLDPKYIGSGTYTISNVDTMPVLAYVLTDYTKAKFKWLHMYGLRKTYEGYMIIGGIKTFNSYLMPDRKTPSKYKVIFTVTQ